ncbi:hypothetical protein NEOLEDRAFT_1042839, partial [Neolentinus lepideus HHB14362 ss-1]
MRKEFWQLEILDYITELEYNGLLPDDVMGPTRGDVIHAFQTWKGYKYVPPRVPSTLNWSYADPCDIVPPERTQLWRVLSKKRTAPKQIYNSPAKHKQNKPVIAVTQSRTLMKGCQWDAVNYSCVYDSVLSVLWQFYCLRGENTLRSLVSGN